MEKKIPMRPENDVEYIMPAKDKDCLVYSVLSRQSKQKVYLLFNPQYADSGGRGLNQKGMTEYKQFFGKETNKQYIEDYKKTLEKLFAGDTIVYKEDIEIDEGRKDKALKALLNKAMGLVEDESATLDADSLKTISEIFKKIGLLKDEETETEAPRRYCPACPECEYKKFIDEHIASGDIIETEEAHD